MENGKTAGEIKIEEYVSRIKSGESKESILDGLPEVFKIAIEKGLKERDTAFEDEQNLINDSSDLNDISEVRNRLGIETKKTEESFDEVESMSMEDFAVWFAKEVKERNIKSKESAYDILTSRPEFRNLRIQKAFGDSAPLMALYHEKSEDIISFKKQTETEMSGVEGSEYVPDSWDHYKINDEKKDSDKTYKGYLTIDKDQVLILFTPEIRKGIVRRLIQSGYKGQVKFPVTGSRALFAYDNIVMHGIDSENVDKGLNVVQDFLKESQIKFDEPKYGIDLKNEKGESQSYTIRVAELLENSIKDPTINLEEEIKKLKQ